jgi:hypothetical protein
MRGRVLHAEAFMTIGWRRSGWRGFIVFLVLLVVIPLALRRCTTNEAPADPDSETAAAVAPLAEVEESPGAAVAILVDTSGSMRDAAVTGGLSVIAREATESMLDATDAFVKKRPIPIRLAYTLSSDARRAADSAATAARSGRRSTRCPVRRRHGDRHRDAARPDLIARCLRSILSSPTARTRAVAVRQGRARSGPRAKAPSRYFVAFDMIFPREVCLLEGGGRRRHRRVERT